MSPCRAMPTGTRTFQSSICTFSAGTQQVWSLEIESQIESLSIWSHRHLISCLQEWEVFLSPRQGRLDPPKKDGWSAPWNQKHPTSNIWETLKSLQAHNSPPQKDCVMNPCLVENDQRISEDILIFWYYCWWSKSSRSAPWSWAWKAGNHREVGRLQSWCAEKNGLLGQGFIFFCGGISGGKKQLFFTSTSTVCFLKAEVQQLSHGWLLFPWDRRRCGVQWPSIIWQGKWGNIAFDKVYFDSEWMDTVTILLQPMLVLRGLCDLYRVWSLDLVWSLAWDVNVLAGILCCCICSGPCTSLFSCFHFLSESVLVPDGLLPLSPSLIRPKTWPPP